MNKEETYFRQIAHKQHSPEEELILILKSITSIQIRYSVFNADVRKALLASWLLPHSSVIGSHLANPSKHLIASITQLTWHFPFPMYRHATLVL